MKKRRGHKERGRSRLFPLSYPGKVALGLLYSFFIIIFIMNVLIILGLRNEAITEGFILFVLGTTAIITSLMSLFLGVYATLLFKDKAISIFVSMFVGFVILLFILGQIIL